MTRVLTLYLTLGMASSMAFSQSFAPFSKLFPEEDIVRDIHTADLDNDGYPDLITASREDVMAWYRNDGFGGFERMSVLDEELPFCESVRAGDMDGDGWLDIVVCRATLEDLVWYKNLGNGEFSERLPLNYLPQAGHKRTVELADLDGDGDLDVISSPTMIGAGPTYLGVNFNNGDGTFGPHVTLDTAYVWMDYTNLKVADIDMDSDIDILLEWQGLRLYENDGEGNFSEQGPVDGIGAVYDFKLADIDGDGDMDFTNGTSLSINQGNGVFDAPMPLADGFGTPESVAVGDIDGDGDLDIYTTFNNHLSGEEDHIVWFANEGDGQFSAPQIILTTDLNGWSSGAPKRTVHLSDLDADGDLDFLYSDYGRETVRVAMNEGTGASVDFQIEVPELQFPTSINAADLNGDGILDIISNKEQGKLVWFAGNEDGNYQEQTFISSLVGSRPTVIPADLDGDGDVDLSISFGSGNPSWLENDGSGNFISVTDITANNEEIHPQSLGDLDNDGDLDFLTYRDGADQVTWRENLGDNTFGPMITIESESQNNATVAAADIDGDGDLDAVYTTTDAGGSLKWIENLGGGSFGASQILNNSMSAPSNMYVADKEGDGDMDVLVLCTTDLGYTVAWSINQGPAQFDDLEVVAVTAVQMTDIMVSDTDDD